MKIGDTVRFVSEVGGGKISGFQGNNMVLVEDEDGFEIPVLRHEVVVIGEDSPQSDKVKVKLEAEQQAEPVELEPCDKPITYRPKPVERSGGNMLNVYLGFVPSELDSNEFGAYLVNDSNYYLQVLYMTGENASWTCRHMATIEPNTKLQVDTFTRDELNEREHMCVQILAYKMDRTYLLKPALSCDFRLDVIKFYKPHTFQQSPFFRTPALIRELVRDDKVK